MNEGRKRSSNVQKSEEFRTSVNELRISKIHLRISKNKLNFRYPKLVYGYPKLIYGYPKLIYGYPKFLWFLDIGKWISDIRKWIFGGWTAPSSLTLGWPYPVSLYWRWLTARSPWRHWDDTSTLPIWSVGTIKGVIKQLTQSLSVRPIYLATGTLLPTSAALWLHYGRMEK